MSEISRQYQRTESFDEPSSALLTGPVVAYKVYADDGRMEPVRGLAFDEVSIRTLRDIYALGKEPALTNTGQAMGIGSRRRRQHHFVLTDPWARDTLHLLG